MDNTKIQVSDFSLISVIGKGSFAKVNLVRKKNTGKVFAMKILKKKNIEKKKLDAHVMVEKNILKTVDHPFIVKMFYAFQNEKKLYFVLEYCPGGQLFGILSKGQLLKEDMARFYAAQIILGLEYLHNRDIIYRDLKPENILIDEHGYIKIADFGLSKTNATSNDTTSVCGTPEYMAPQILTKTGYGKAIDWWCLGSLIYEMIVGLPPFYTQNKAELFEKIRKGTPKFPKSISKEAKDIIMGLMQKDPGKRLGSNGANEIKAHPWLQNFDWNGLLNRKLQSPYVPKIESDTDVSNFAEEFTQDDIDSSNEASVKSDEQRAFSDFSFDKSEEDKMDEQKEIGHFQFNMVVKTSEI